MSDTELVSILSLQIKYVLLVVPYPVEFMETENLFPVVFPIEGGDMFD